jgi:hypothetical protein
LQLVIDAAGWTASLPHIIEAFFLPASAPSMSVLAAQQLHNEYLTQYELDAWKIPLLRLDIETKGDSPFSLHV